MNNQMIDKLFTTVLIIIAIIVIVSMLKNDGSNVEKIVEKTNQRIESRIDSLQNIIEKKFESIRLIDSSKTIIKNIYEIKGSEVDEIKDDSGVVLFIRDQLLRVGAARFD